MLFKCALMAWCLALSAGCVTAQANHFPHSLTARQASPSTNDCNSTCTNFQELQANCNVPHCGCTVPFVQAQGECLLCESTTPQDDAAVQYLLDTELNQCHSEGFNVTYQLDLPPAAVAIVQKFNRDSATLRRSQTAFLALQISGGHIGLVVVLAFALFSREIRRDPTFLNFCITWIFSSIVFSILLYRGTQGNDLANSLGFVTPNQCLAQAALTEGAQVMTACSTLALVIQLWLGLRAAIHGPSSDGSKQSKWINYTLLLAPYVSFIAIALPSAFVGMGNVEIEGSSFERAIPTNFYCAVVGLNSFLQAIYGITLGLLLVTVGFDVLIVNVLYRHWRAFRHVETGNAVSLSILLRVMMFSVYRIVVAAAYGTVITQPPIPNSSGEGDSVAIIFSIPIWVDMLQAAIPLIAFLVLGINRDMINSFMFWRKFRAPKSMTATTISNGRSSTMNVARSSTNSTRSSTKDNTWDEKRILTVDTKFISVPV